MANSSEYENSTSRTEGTSWNAYSTSNAILAGLNIFLAITASLANALILISLHKLSSIYPPTKLLFRCLAVTDLLGGLVSQPLCVINLLTQNVFHLAIWHAGLFFFRLLSIVSVLTSAAISVDRLLALLLGLRYRHTVTLRRVRVVIAHFWLISALQATETISSRYKKLPLISRWLFCVLLLLSLVVSVFSYSKILKTLRYRQAQIHDNTQQRQPNGGGNQLSITRYKKTVYNIAWVQLALLVCHAPFCVVYLIHLLDKQPPASTATAITWYSLITLLYLNSSLNPALYCWRIKAVRQEVKSTIRQIFCCFC